MAVRPSFISADVKRSRPGPWQIFTRNLIVRMCLGLIWKERQSFTDIWFIDSKKFKTIQRLRLKIIQTCSSITRPASSKSIREDFFIVPTLILRPPNFRSRYLFEKVGQKEKVWKVGQKVDFFANLRWWWITWALSAQHRDPVSGRWPKFLSGQMCLRWSPGAASQ